MFDLHCHLLPGIDDGATDLAMSLQMARMAVADGITLTACTPHIYPGLYENTGPGIRSAIAALQGELDREGIALRLVEGADVHLDQNLVAGIRNGRVPTLAGSRYLLFEPPHHVAPPRLEETLFELMAAGYVPVITHPERLTWVEQHYETFVRLAHRGSWIQVTAGALTGRYGRRAKHWGEKFVGEGHCHILATDAHHPIPSAACRSWPRRARPPAARAHRRDRRALRAHRRGRGQLRARVRAGSPARAADGELRQPRAPRLSPVVARGRRARGARHGAGCNRLGITLVVLLRQPAEARVLGVTALVALGAILAHSLVDPLRTPAMLAVAAALAGITAGQAAQGEKARNTGGAPRRGGRRHRLQRDITT